MFSWLHRVEPGIKGGVAHVIIQLTAFQAPHHPPKHSPCHTSSSTSIVLPCNCSYTCPHNALQKMHVSLLIIFIYIFIFKASGGPVLWSWCCWLLASTEWLNVNRWTWKEPLQGDVLQESGCSGGLCLYEWDVGGGALFRLLCKGKNLVEVVLCPAIKTKARMCAWILFPNWHPKDFYKAFWEVPDAALCAFGWRARA